MKVDRLVCGYLEENCYIISNEIGDAIIVDPGDNADIIVSEKRTFEAAESYALAGKKVCVDRKSVV